ncbi:918_t:CDS:2 [Entrophospora sp. SA101]|nr:918_t:CDS:2 [Entrophospora sp. SA101]
MTNDEYTTITIEKDNDAETNKKVKSMGSESGDNSDVEVVTIEGEKSMESETDLDLNEESPSDPSTRRTTMFQNAMNAVATSSKGKECADLIVDANLDEGEGGVESEEGFIYEES